MRKHYLLLFLLVLMVGVGVHVSAWAFEILSKPKKQLVVATYTYGDNNRLANIEPMAVQMANALGATLRLKSYASVGALVAGLRNGEADVAVMNTFGYLLLQTDPKPAVVPLAALEVPADAHDKYTSCLIARKSSGINHVSQLGNDPKAYHLVFAGRHSTSGNLIPKIFLGSLGILDSEKQFAQVSFAQSHAQALESVIKGTADVAALGAGEYDKQLADGRLRKEDVTLLWESTDIPQGPVVCKASLSAKEKKVLLSVLLKAHDQNPEIISQLVRAWTEAREAKQFVPVTEKYYQNIIQMAGNRSNLRKILEQNL